jgi:hypothetical protein
MPIAERHPHPFERHSGRDAIDGIMDAVPDATAIDIETEHT